MMNDLKDMLEMLSEKGYTPSEFMILYELSCYNEFIELEEHKQRLVHDEVYREYIGCEITSIEELTRTAIDHLDELLTNENFDFFRYL
jgi:hypothetical protein